MSKAEKKIRKSVNDPVAGLADSLSATYVEARRAGLSPSQRQVLAKASRRAELTYLRSVRPWSAPAEEQIRKSEDDDALIAKAAAIRKADPDISEYQAMRRAAG